MDDDTGQCHINIGQLAWNVQEVTPSPILNVNLDL